MPLAYNTSNYLFGKGRLMFKADDSTGYLDLGNCPNFELTPEISKEDHYSSRSGVKEKDLTLITEKKLTGSITLEEFSAENINLAFAGDGIISGAQAAGTIDAVATTLVDDLFVDLEKTHIFYLKLSHGSVTGTLAVAETVTGGTSTATAKVVYLGSGYIECLSLTGTFVTGETITGGTSSATAVLSGVETMDGAIVTDADQSTRYTLGTDYSIDAAGGMIRELSETSTITSHAVDVSCNYSAKTTKSIRALVNSKADGELIFIGDPDQGPQLRVQMWDVEMIAGGSVGLISDSVAQFQLSLEVLSTAATHPTEPFMRVTEQI